MWRFFAKLFMFIGVIGFIGAFLFLWGYFWGYSKAGLILELIIRFVVQMFTGIALYFLGDHMLRIYDEEKTVEHLIKNINMERYLEED